jgi:hypothetical protein
MLVVDKKEKKKKEMEGMSLDQQAIFREILSPWARRAASRRTCVSRAQHRVNCAAGRDARRTTRTAHTHAQLRTAITRVRASRRGVHCDARA